MKENEVSGIEIKERILFMPKFDSVAKLKKEVSKEDFLRHVLISLAKDDKAPSNIAEASFGEVTERSIPMLLLSADVHVTYSASIGYDRKETYYEYRKNSDGTTTRVEKTRTVTDWSPYSGALDTSKTTYETNSEECDRDLELCFGKAFKTSKGEPVPADEIAVSPRAYSAAIDECEAMARAEIKWPGDHQKDKNVNCTSKATAISCYITPVYDVTYTYGGKEYKVSGFAIGEPNDTHEIPSGDDVAGVETVEKIEERRRADQEQVRKPAKIVTIISSIGLGVGLIGGLAMLTAQITVGGIILLVLAGIFLAGIITAQIIRSTKCKAIWNKAYEEERKLKDLKITCLTEALARSGYKALSEDEIEGLKR